MTALELWVPAPLDSRGKPEWLNANQRMHWAPKNRITQAWRNATHYMARQAQLPSMECAHITILVHKTNNRTYDVHNLMPTMKAAIDGLIDHGLLPDDNNKHLTGPDLRVGARRDRAAITIQIKETK